MSKKPEEGYIDFDYLFDEYMWYRCAMLLLLSESGYIKIEKGMAVIERPFKVPNTPPIRMSGIDYNWPRVPTGPKIRLVGRGEG